MSTTSTRGSLKVGLLTALSIVLAIIVAVEGAAFYKVTKQATALRHDTVSVNPLGKTPSLKLNQPSATRFIGASPSLWNATQSSSSDPWGQIEQFHNRMDQLFADTFAQSGLGGTINNNLSFTVPNMDLQDAKDHYTVRMDMPGADKGTIKVDVDGRLLTVSGQRETSNETNDGDRAIRSERSTTEFERTITLPTLRKGRNRCSQLHQRCADHQPPESRQRHGGNERPCSLRESKGKGEGICQRQ